MPGMTRHDRQGQQRHEAEKQAYIVAFFLFSKEKKSKKTLILDNL